MNPMQRSRVWVQYRAGQKATARELLQRAGAIFHYDFGDLDSFVVTLPENNLSALSGSPIIADYWYASMMTQNEPVLRI
jgi:hypothetical protein